MYKPRKSLLRMYLLAFLTTGSITALAGNVEEQTLMNQGIERQIAIHVPTSYSGDSPVALVLSLANRDTAVALNLGDWVQKSEDEGFLLVGVAGAAGWNEGSGRGPAEKGIDDVAFVLSVIEKIKSEYTIDPNLVFATGFSMSGGMTFRLGMEAGEKFRALASHSSAYWLGIKPIEAPPHMLFIIGDSDGNNPMEGGGRGTPKKPVQVTVDSWLQTIGAAIEPVQIDQADHITISKFEPGRNGAIFEYWLVEGLDHDWLGSDRYPELQGSSSMNATDIIWDFFSTDFDEL